MRIGERLESPAKYASHLVQLWQLHTSAEMGLQALDFRPLGFVYPSPYRAALLEADLDFLGISSARLQALPLPLAPTLRSLAAGLGCIYVVEGSAKGARAILPDIKSALGFDSEGGAAFFSGRRQEGKLLWRAWRGGDARTMPNARIFLVAGLYSLGAHGIMTLNDFKSVEGDKRSGVGSLPVKLGVERAGRLACAVMAVPQLVVIAVLLAWGLPIHAATVALLLVVQFGLMVRLLESPRERAPWYNATGVTLYVLGMLVTALALGSGAAGATP